MKEIVNLYIFFNLHKLPFTGVAMRAMHRSVGKLQNLEIYYL